MKKIFFVSLVIILLGITLVSAVNYDQALSNRLKGKLLLAVEDKGRIWYVNPTDLKKYEVTFANALSLFKKLSLGITNKDLNQISETKSTILGNKLKGKLLLAVEDKGRIWYIDSNGLKHEVTWDNLMDLFKKLSIGITNTDLNKIIQGLIVGVVVDVDSDLDKDALIYIQEIMYGTDPNNPDTDNDTYLDGNEVQYGYDPLIAGSARLEKQLIAYIINDSRCEECIDMVEYTKPQLQTMFPNIRIREFDYLKPDGQAFYKYYKLAYLPAVLLTDNIKSEPNYKDLINYLTTNQVDNKLLSLNLGSTFNPLKEICDNYIDDTDNGRVDCDDSDCSGNLVCRANTTKKLDLFVMSRCPYGIQALNSMKDVLNNFKDKINFQIHYIASETADGVFNSLHGQGEVDENIRELCAIKHYPDNYKYMDYVWCINKLIEKNSTNYDWETCANDFPKIKSCASGDEGKQLLSEDIKLSNELQIGASPTGMVNNRYEFSGIDAETIKQNFCKHNADLGNMCANKLPSNVGGGGSCN